MVTSQKAKCIDSPVIGECKLIFECKLVLKQVMEPGKLDSSIREKFYSDDDYHVLYYGEILDCNEQ
jgi:flavin reductase (DIM6/NTAB) family NADH-FMN oxidoreductase RutF